ncbi:hypothetical protein RchiOBHm_Chr1g0346881 [Rosa chinensis]|uniref:Uncharacterized protein n=1 Tax=Rosa chinensis TaxID=74649 RepID=A0A2P6SF51_ROSCH|nr:hypothetical protein RchiOBHm_Chr1g0346881 [Rosa chinensis]
MLGVRPLHDPKFQIQKSKVREPLSLKTRERKQICNQHASPSSLALILIPPDPDRWLEGWGRLFFILSSSVVFFNAVLELWVRLGTLGSWSVRPAGVVRRCGAVERWLWRWRKGQFPDRFLPRWLHGCLGIGLQLSNRFNLWWRGNVLRCGMTMRCGMTLQWWIFYRWDWERLCKLSLY